MFLSGVYAELAARLIEEDNGIGTPAHGLRQLAALIEANVPCACSQQPAGDALDHALVTVES